jgi:hypothetical protein
MPSRAESNDPPSKLDKISSLSEPLNTFVKSYALNSSTSEVILVSMASSYWSTSSPVNALLIAFATFFKPSTNFCHF